MTPRELVLRAGFPPAGVPAFNVPMVFWSRVVRDAEAGRIVGGFQALVELAAAGLPGNRPLAAYRSRSLGGSGTNAPPPTRAIDNRGASRSSFKAHATFETMTVGTAACVVVTGSRELSGVERIYLSSLSSELAAVAPTSVAVVPPR